MSGCTCNRQLFWGTLFWWRSEKRKSPLELQYRPKKRRQKRKTESRSEEKRGNLGWLFVERSCRSTSAKRDAPRDARARRPSRGASGARQLRLPIVGFRCAERERESTMVLSMSRIGALAMLLAPALGVPTALTPTSDHESEKGVGLIVHEQQYGEAMVNCVSCLPALASCMPSIKGCIYSHHALSHNPRVLCATGSVTPTTSSSAWHARGAPAMVGACAQERYARSHCLQAARARTARTPSCAPATTCPASARRTTTVRTQPTRRIASLARTRPTSPNAGRKTASAPAWLGARRAAK